MVDQESDAYNHGTVPVGKVVAALALVVAAILGSLGALFMATLVEHGKELDALRTQDGVQDNRLKGHDRRLQELEDLHPRTSRHYEEGPPHAK